MQQTTQYKLNKPDLDDNIAVAPLNENMDKVEAAILAEIAARQSADAAEASARQSAIAAEVQTLQAAVGSEAQARAAADASEVQARQSAITSEIQARQAAVDSEAQTRAAADASEAQARQTAMASEAATRQSADTALEQRIAILELHKVVAGSYVGNGARFEDAQTINLGFTPVAVIIEAKITNDTELILCTPDRGNCVVEIIPGGFTVKYMVMVTSQASANTNGTKYRYAALC